MAEDAIDAAIAGIADRTPVDWDELEKEAGSAEDRSWLDCARILGGIADLHRALFDPSQEEATGTTAEPTVAVAVDEARYWGRYRLVQKVGEGGFGSVYRAWDPELEREVAIKILHRRVADARLREGLLREGRALARVRDPHVVSVLGVETDGEQIALCMEFVHGETLEDSLRRHGTLSAREAALVGEDLCRALAAVHLAGFVHRDVKARNVMRETAGRIVLMDFGAGQKADDLKVPGQIRAIGTPPYMAPELLAGQSATVCSDVYSVGVLLYRLVTGEYPIEGQTPDELRAAHMQGQRRLLSERRPNLPAGFIDVVDRALAADPAKRFASAGALLEALRTLGVTARKTRVMVWAPALVLIAFAAIVFLGFLTTAAFNLNVGRSAPFDNESPMVWLEMGLRSLLSPILYISIALLVASAVGFAVRVVSVFQPVGRALSEMDARVKRFGRRINFDDPTVFAQAVASLGVIALALIIWRFSNVILAFTTFSISDAPAERLMTLRLDENRVDPSNYRRALDVLALCLGAALFRIRRLTAARQRAAWSAAALPVAGLLVLTVLLIEVPFRLVWRADAQKISFGDQRCYILGEHDAEALIYCPDKAPPRNRVVTLDDPAVRRLGIVENIFSPPDPTR